MELIAIDPSGNYKEGFGTSGFAYFHEDELRRLEEIKAQNYASPESYWNAHVSLLECIRPSVIVMEGYKLYNHKGQAASKQANSELETPQLIGLIKWWCYRKQIPLHIQWASEVKTRWSDEILVRVGVLEKGLKFKGKRTNAHKRDAIRHGLHYWRYKRKQ